ncbi:MAG TPA: inositol monophosphatase family protein [Patescibacteria group bacterium]|nr:inositol monophosphatase family protein [Patescibacteria group bacterium]
MDLYRILKDACFAAGKIQLDNYNREIEVSKKTNAADLVTEVDFKSQDVIIKSLTDSITSYGIDNKDLGFIAEEKGVEKNAEHLFIIDPMDGTGNYVEGNGFFCVSIAYLLNSEIIAGGIYRPTENTFYFAQKGKGAFSEKNEIKKELRVKDCKLEDSNIGYNTAAWPEVTEKALKGALKFVYKVKKVNQARSAVLSILSVAENKYQASLIPMCFVWDFAAAKIIVEESGGVISDWKGNKLEYDLKDTKRGYEILSVGSDLYEPIVRVLST